jgi:D-alanyl-D-alanine carboxypeptidase
VASLIGRIFRYFLFVLAFAAMALPATGIWAAPFAAVVIDARSGETLYEKNADARLHPASLTKMMTLYITFEEIRAGRLSLDTKITISKHAASQPPSSLGLKPGQKIALRYLIRAAAVKSANDAATAIGETIGGGSEAEFAKRMTRTAKALGMKNSTFKNANGLTAPGHLTTARDMTTLGRRLFYDFPEFYNIFSRRTADAGIATVRSTNARFLDNYKGADGIKTGYTVAAGFNLTASAERGNTRIIATILGGSSTANRNAKMAELLDLGFGKAPTNAQVTKPAAPTYADDDLIAMDDGLPEDVPGSAAKTVRVSGEVKVSMRPRSRPAPAAIIPPEVDVAIAEGIEGALAEATAPPPPEGTLEAQAQALADVPEMAPDTVPTEVAVAEVAAVLPPTTPAPPPGTLDAQALALVDPTAAPAAGTLEAQALALANGVVTGTTPEPAPGDPAVQLASSLLPRARPSKDAPLTETAPVEIAEAVTPEASEPAIETVVADASDTVAPIQSDATGQVTDIETVAGIAPSTPAPASFAALSDAPKRRAPIFETVAQAEPAAPAEQEVVVAVSTSGGSNWGVSVGGYTSQVEAEKALFKLALAESATLNGGLRKVVQKNEGFAALFLGLSEEQADLACRRLAARAVPCEAIGS